MIIIVPFSLKLRWKFFRWSNQEVDEIRGKEDISLTFLFFRFCFWNSNSRSWKFEIFNSNSPVLIVLSPFHSVFKNFLIASSSLETTFPSAAIENKECSHFEFYDAAQLSENKKFLLWNKKRKVEKNETKVTFLCSRSTLFFAVEISDWMIERNVVCHDKIPFLEVAEENN